MKLKITLVLLVAAALFSLQINKPFYGYHDWNGLTYGQIARNYVKYGPIKTSLGQVENFTTTTKENFLYDTHYPPLFTLLLSIPVFMFGPNEWAIRLLPAFISLLNLFLIYRLGCLLVSPRLGLLASILALCTPIFIYFGKNPVHEPLTLTFILLNTILFYKTLNEKSPKYFRHLLFSASLSLFSGWPVYYHLPLLTFFGFLKTKKKKFFIFAILPFFGLIIHLLHIKLLTGSFAGGGLIQIILYRLSLTRNSPSDSYTLFQFISRFLLFSRNMFTIPLLLAALPGFFLCGKYRVYLLILATGILHPIVFSNIGYIHDYLQLPFLGFLSLSAAIFFYKVAKQKFLILGLVFGLFSLWSKWPFTTAMINSYMSKPEYDLVINQIKPLKLGDTITLPSNQALLLSGVVTPYYLQTEVEFMGGNTPDFLVVRQEDKLIVKPNDSN